MNPLPKHVGHGITSKVPLNLPGYEYKPVGNYHNYHATAQGWKWPETFQKGKLTIDGCSPNLNKQLHCGHVKNLAVATALTNLIGSAVAMLGKAIGEIEGAFKNYEKWCQLAGYQPTIYFDTELPAPKVFMELEAGTGEYEGCLLHNGVVVYRSNGKATYAAHDLAFAHVVKPDYYLTGSEQKAHFAALGLGEKHLPLGLVLGADGKKMRSSIKKEGEEANSLSAQELIDLVKNQLSETPEPEKLAWNILAWQFNSSNVAGTTKFNAEVWAKPESPGLYITYTYARINKALSQPGTPSAKEENLTPEQVNLLHEAEQAQYYLIQGQKTKEPCQVAQYTLQLAKTLSHLYKKTSISEGSPGGTFAFTHAKNQLEACMKILGMHPLTTV